MKDPLIRKIKQDRTRKIAYKARGPRAKVLPLDDPQLVPTTLLIAADDYLPLEGAHEPSKEGDLPLSAAHRAGQAGDLPLSGSPVPPEAQGAEVAVRSTAPERQGREVGPVGPPELSVVPYPVNKPAHAGRGHEKIDLAKAIDLRFKHRLSIKEIAEYFGCVPSSVTSRLTRYMKHLPNLAEVRALDSIRPDIIKGTLLKNLASLSDPAKLKKASLNNVAYSAGQLHSMLRLEEGKSTQNVFTADYFAYIKEQARGLSPKKPNDIDTESV